MRARQGTLAAIGLAIDNALEESELADALRPHRAVAIWPEVVGHVLAEASRPEAVRRGVLFVRTRSAAWANELIFYKAEILRKLNDRLGGEVLDDIHFHSEGRRPLERNSPNQERSDQRSYRGAAATERPSEVDLGEAADAGQPASFAEVRTHLNLNLARAARAREWKRSRGWSACARCGCLYPPAFQVGMTRREAAPHRGSPGTRLCPLCAAGQP